MTTQPSSLLDEFFRGRSLHQKQIDFFLKKGVPIDALSTPRVILNNDVVFDEDGGTFTFARHTNDPGKPAITILVEGTTGPIDIAAWSPPRLASWIGHSYALDEWRVFAPKLDNDPLSVWRTPLGWLRANRDGIVFLPKMRTRAGMAMADHLPALLAEDVPHGRELKRLQREPRLKIYVPEASIRRAAAK
jgi:hypothetical protein